MHITLCLITGNNAQSVEQTNVQSMEPSHVDPGVALSVTLPRSQKLTWPAVYSLPAMPLTLLEKLGAAKSIITLERTSMMDTVRILYQDMMQYTLLVFFQCDITEQNVVKFVMYAT